MIIVLCLRWWYSAGWYWVWEQVLVDRLVWINEIFSTKDLLRTIFAPYRQTYAGKIRGSLGAQFRAFADRTISRIIGAIVRLALIFIASIASLFFIVMGIFTMLTWPFLPLLPLIAIAMTALGVGS